MASAWGGSWGSAWGNSWGFLLSGRVSGGGISRNRKRLIYIPEKEKILVFRNATDAAKYTKAKKEHKKPEVSVQVIDLPALERFSVPIARVFGEPFETAHREFDIELMLEMMRKVREWIDEEEVLLLVMQ